MAWFIFAIAAFLIFRWCTTPDTRWFKGYVDHGDDK